LRPPAARPILVRVAGDSSTARLFVYGTLTDPAQVQRVTGRDLRRRPAVLDDFVRREPPGAYPWIEPEPGARVDGWLLDGVDADVLAALDAYEDEGRLYHRRPVVVTAGGRRVACETYVGVPAVLARVRRG
jgi:gamma-glutamylcyclotransferase (GGCT)/AIG2-like uncharacterized protein YtfP